jgi:proteasome lid subunit RPN8/RPN11
LSLHHEGVVLTDALRGALVAAIRERHPRKSFGYLVSDDEETRQPTDFFLFEANDRNSDRWKSEFEAYGQYFVDHDDAGFVATPEETLAVHNEMVRRRVFEVGIFHSHQRHPANFSMVDYEMHLRYFETLWHLIVSMRTPAYPRLRAFVPTRSGVVELPLLSCPR